MALTGLSRSYYRKGEKGVADAKMLGSVDIW